MPQAGIPERRSYQGWPGPGKGLGNPLDCVVSFKATLKELVSAMDFDLCEADTFGTSLRQSPIPGAILLIPKGIPRGWPSLEDAFVKFNIWLRTKAPEMRCDCLASDAAYKEWSLQWLMTAAC